MSDFAHVLKEIIQKVLFCSGEPYAVSTEPVNLLYSYIRKVSHCITLELNGKSPHLCSILEVCRQRPVHIDRIAQYFAVVSHIPNTNLTTSFNGDEMESAGMMTEHQPDQDKFTALCKQLKISPTNLQDYSSDQSNSFFNELHQGRLLRLKRIDMKYATDCSVNDFLHFTQMRQSAGFLNLVKSSHHCKLFVRWYFESDNCDDTGLNRDQLNLLAYLLTGDVLNVIDLALFHRTKLKIDIKSPLTPIELCQAIKKLDKMILFANG